MDRGMGSRSRRLAFAGLFVVVAGGLAVYCAIAASESARGGSKAGTHASAEPIVIGVLSAKSGIMSPFDVPARVGVQRAMNDLNKKGGLLGRPLKMITWNSKSDTTEAARGGTNLLRQGAKFLFVSCDFDYGGPAATVAQSQNVLS